MRANVPDNNIVRHGSKMLSSDIDNYIKEIDTAITNYFDPKQSDLHLLAQNAIVNGGKRIRGLLCLLSCELVSGSYSNAILIAAGYEFYHAAALIQDDIIDNAEFRRGESSTYKKHGVNTALLISDFLLFELHNILAQYSKNVDNYKVSLILSTFGKYAQQTTLGEYLDIQLGKKENLNLSDYITMVSYKTGALLTASAVTGAIIGSATQIELNIIREYSDNHGIAYQIHDDILDITGNPDKMGKPIFKDICGGKKNILVIHVLIQLAKLKDKRKIILENIISKKSIDDSDKKYILSLVDEFKAIEYATNLADKYSNFALNALAKLKDSKSKRLLMDLSSYLSTRYC